MSAYFVPETTIDVIVSYAVARGLYVRLTKGNPPIRIERHNARDFGKMLWNANRLSINARYPTRPADDAWGDDAMRRMVNTYEPRLFVVTPFQAMGCARNLAYQACEIDKWEASRCQLACLKVESDAGSQIVEGKLTGETPWGMDDASDLRLMDPADAN